MRREGGSASKWSNDSNVQIQRNDPFAFASMLRQRMRFWSVFIIVATGHELFDYPIKMIGFSRQVLIHCLVSNDTRAAINIVKLYHISRTYCKMGQCKSECGSFNNTTYAMGTIINLLINKGKITRIIIMYDKWYNICMVLCATIRYCTNNNTYVIGTIEFVIMGREIISMYCDNII